MVLVQLPRSGIQSYSFEQEQTMNLKISNRKVDGVTIMDLNGRIVLGEESSALRQAIKDLLARGERKIVLNLANVSYMDSSGLGVLVGGFTSVSNEGGQVKLLNLSGKVHDLLRVTKLLTVFEVFDDESKVVRSFA
jgi:anti-sigma B factor antagonist